MDKKAMNESPKYWLSLEQWAGDSQFQKLAEEEFQSSPFKEDEKSQGDKDGGWARREFLTLMGASLALGSVSCLRRPVQKIVPYVNRPEELILGMPNWYASNWTDGLESHGLLVKTREGRPILVEGNHDHPANRGGMSPRAIAHILRLYDPERIKGPKRNLLNKEKANRDTVSTSWKRMDKSVVTALKRGRVALLSGEINSPSTEKLVKEFKNRYGVKHHRWEPVSNEDVIAGQSLSYGRAVLPRYRFDRAKVIVSVSADFLGTWLTPTIFTKDFSKSRKPGKQMSQLVVFESNMSLTGMNADIRTRIKPSQQVDVVMGILHELIIKQGHSSYKFQSSVTRALKPFANVAVELGIEEAVFSQLAQKLWQHRGESLIVAGGLEAQTENALSLQTAVNFLNHVLRNDGKTVSHGKEAMVTPRGSYADVVKLVEAMKAGQVKTLIVHGVNPAYALPESLGFHEAIKKVDLVVYTGDRNDETGRLANYIAPDHHPLENWGDAEMYRGLYHVQQPTISPMYDTRSFQDSLLKWQNKSEDWYTYLRRNWKDSIFTKKWISGSFEDRWLKLLQAGFFAISNSANKTQNSRSFRVGSLKGIGRLKSDGYELVLYTKNSIGDGSMANVSWLQELPDPVTKIVWDNYLNVSLKTAEEKVLKEGQLVTLKVGDRELRVPVHIAPGVHDDVLGLALGYGRRAAGKVGDGVGVNAYSLLNVSSSGVVASGLKVSFEKVDAEIYSLVSPQDQHTTHGRPIALDVTLKDYLKDNRAGIHKHPTFSIWPTHEYKGHKWAMTIDLNQCTGCSACVVACQAENNVPTVGKKYVMQGREMHWIRIDRYFSGSPENPDSVFQAMLCQHCDNAPCETVCPVIATSHSDEGLNEMIYNRCVGTRYCSNNCPYKVRRFNWFNLHKDLEKPEQMVYNPEVTVRSRGVMEKCSFCVQRIKSAKNEAKDENRKLRDGDVVTACQSSCPTDAIVFGDFNDLTSKVSQSYKDARSFTALEEFNAGSVIRYQTKVRNNEKTTAAHDGGHH